MNIKNTFNKIVLGTTFLSATACREPLYKLPENISNPIVQRVDSFAKSSLNKIDTIGLDLFKVDTIQISHKDLNNTKKLSENLVDRASKANPEICTDVKLSTGYGITSTGKMGVIIENNYIYTPKYIPLSIKAEMQNKVFSNKNRTKFYVPVNYYGKKNPNLAPRYFREN